MFHHKAPVTDVTGYCWWSISSIITPCSHRVTFCFLNRRPWSSFADAPNLSDEYCNLHPCPTIHTISNIWITFLSFSGLLELHRSSIQSSTNITNKSQTRLNTFSFLLLIRLVNAYLENRARVAGGRWSWASETWAAQMMLRRPLTMRGIL